MRGWCGLPKSWKNVTHGPRPQGVWRPPPLPSLPHPFDPPKPVGDLGPYDEIDEISLYSWHSSCPDQSNLCSPEPSETALQAQQIAALIDDFATNSDVISDMVDSDATGSDVPSYEELAALIEQVRAGDREFLRRWQ